MRVESCAVLAMDDLRLPLAWDGKKRTEINISCRLPWGQLWFATVTAVYGPRGWRMVCPRCARGCLKLYVLLPATDLACRACHRLVYRSQYDRPAAWACMF